MDILIRAMQPEDAVAVNLLSAQLGYPHPVTATRDRIQHLLRSQEDCLLVAVAGTEVIGWLHAFKTLRLEAGTFAEISGLVVDEKHRGKKAGEQLVAAAKEWCRQQDCIHLKVRSNTVRTQAHHFYLKAGFREAKVSRVFELDLY